MEGEIRTTPYLHGPNDRSVPRSFRIFLFTTIAVAVSALVFIWLETFMDLQAPFSVFFSAIMVAAWLGGARPALYALVLGLTFYALAVSEELLAAGSDDTIVVFGVYSVVGLSIAFLGEVIHREKRRALAQAGALRVAEERATRAQSAAKLGVWEIDLRTGTCFFSSTFREIHGIGDRSYSVEEALALLHPEGRERQQASFVSFLANRKEEWSGISRSMHPELGARWLSSRARVEYDAGGSPVLITGTSMDITEQRAVQERSSRAQEVAQAGTWELDLVARKAFLSAEFCTLIGRKHQQVFAFEAAFAAIHPEDLPMVKEQFARTLQEGREIYQVEHRHVLPDGQVKWRLSRGRVDRDEAGAPLSMAGATMDITERKLVELALRSSEERFRLATEAINGMIYDHDLCTGKVERSDGLVELLGIKPSEAPPLVQWWVSRIHPEDSIGNQRIMDDVFREKRPLFDLEYRVEHQAGHWVWVNDKGRCSYNKQGELVRVVGCTTDISVRKKAEVELLKADKAKDDFLATLAHELRNPLSPLQHAIDLLDVINNDQQMLLSMREMMDRQMKHLVRLVDDLLDLSRISRGKIELRRTVMDLGLCVRSAIEANRHMMERQGHHLVVEMPAHCYVNGDMERLTQVVSNLLHNAAKFTPPQGRIRLTVRTTEHDAVVEVQDNGPGLDQDSLDKIFEMFVQAGDNSHGGLGIGLNLVRRLVVKHGGTVSANSGGLGTGCTFTVRLPLQVEDSTDGDVQRPTLVTVA